MLFIQPLRICMLNLTVVCEATDIRGVVQITENHFWAPEWFVWMDPSEIFLSITHDGY